MAVDIPASFTGEVLTPSSGEVYTKSLTRWAKNAEKPAAYVAFPKTNEDIVVLLKWALENKVEIAVKGGGHSASGASSVQGGLVIDLAKEFNKVRVDKEERKAFVGGGALWEDVDKAVIEHGLGTVGGTVNHTGVGGLILGGGYGFLSGEHGLVIDNLLEATVVTANGQILKASDTSNTELFWGIRGGGGNFGIVTEFVLRLHPQRRTVYAGILVFTPAHLAKLAETFANIWKKGFNPKQSGLLALTNAPPAPDQITVLALVFYNGTVEEGKSAWKDVLDLGPVMDMTGEVPYEAINTLQNPNVPHGRNVYMGGTSYSSASSTAIESAFTHLQSVLKSQSGAPMSYMAIFEYFPLEKINEVPQDATAFPNRGERSGVAFAGVWDGEEESEERLDKAKVFLREMKGLVGEVDPIAAVESKAQNGHANGHANGDADPSKSNYWYANFECELNAPPSRSKMVFKENYARLQKVKAMYDPGCVFSRWFGIEPAIEA